MASRSACGLSAGAAGRTVHRPQAEVWVTILAGTKCHRLKAGSYLADVMQRLSVGETDRESLRPDRSGASHPKPMLQHRLDESPHKAARPKEARRERRDGRVAGVRTTDAEVRKALRV